MTHLSVQQLVDYVRQLAPAASQELIREHLRSCAACRASVEAFEPLVALAASDAQTEVPVEAISRAQAIFEPRPADRSWIEGLQALVAELVFDNGLQLHRVGVRSSAQAGSGAIRHLTYRAGEYNVDLQTETTGGGEVEIVGQVAPLQSRGQNLEGALVQVIVGGKTVGETETNRFGEFLLGRPFKLAGTLRIVLRQAGCRIELPLRQVKRH
mgnify:CR=1 FL=1